MRLFENTRTLTIVIAVLGFCSVISAREEQSADSYFDAGAGVIYRTSPYKGDDDEIIPIPMIFYDTETIFLRGLTGGYHLFEGERLSLDLIVQFRTDGYEDDDSRHLRGMGERRMSFDGGMGCSYYDGWGTTRFSFVNDLLGYHDGQEISLGYSKRFSEGRLSFVPSAGVIWQSSNLTDYYYGVRGKEARAGRVKYSTNEAWNPFAALQVMYEINHNWSAMTIFSYKWLDSEISDSPIINDDYEISAIIGLTYKF